MCYGEVLWIGFMGDLDLGLRAWDPVLGAGGGGKSDQKPGAGGEIRCLEVSRLASGCEV